MKCKSAHDILRVKFLTNEVNFQQMCDYRINIKKN